jgi:hypothetical protein
MTKFVVQSQYFPEGLRKATRNLEPQPVILVGYTSMVSDKLHIFCILLPNTWNTLSTALPGIKVSDVQRLKLKTVPPPALINK